MVGKLPEELSGALLETIPVDLTVIDADNRIVWWNHPGTRVFKIPEGMVGGDVMKCHPEHAREEVERMLKEMKEGKREKARVWGKAPSGQMMVTEYHAIRGEGGKYLGCMEIDIDITEIQKLEGEKKTID